MQVRSSAEVLAKQLEEIETKQIGGSARPDVNQRVAKTLLDLMK
jgi:hypothetical protein